MNNHLCDGYISLNPVLDSLLLCGFLQYIEINRTRAIMSIVVRGYNIYKPWICSDFYEM